MIVPKLNITAARLLHETELVTEIRYWGFMGSACLELTGPWTTENLKSFRSVIKKSSGYCDLVLVVDQIEQADMLDEETALEMLNDGVSSLIYWTSNGSVANWQSIPENRLIYTSGKPTSDDSDTGADNSPAQWIYAREDQLLPEFLAPVLKSKRHVLVEVDALQERPSLIADTLQQTLRAGPDGLWPTVICDPLGIALGLAYSNYESLLHAISSREGTYWSRSRDQLWIKGKTSGATQTLLGLRIDCDADCLRFTVTQDVPGFCHLKTHTCFGEERSIATVISRLKERVQSTNEKSFTRRLAIDAALLERKLLEEASELSEAAQAEDTYEVAWEAADVLYFSLVAMLKHDVGLEEVYAELARRMNRVVRRD